MAASEAIDDGGDGLMVLFITLMVLYHKNITAWELKTADADTAADIVGAAEDSHFTNSANSFMLIFMP